MADLGAASRRFGIPIFSDLWDCGDWSSALGDAMAKPRDDHQKDLLRPALEAIIDLGHPLVRLAREIDWGVLDGRFAKVCRRGVGQPPLPTRLVAGLFILNQAEAVAHSPPLAAACIEKTSARLHMSTTGSFSRGSRNDSRNSLWRGWRLL